MTLYVNKKSDSIINYKRKKIVLESSFLPSFSSFINQRQVYEKREGMKGGGRKRNRDNLSIRSAHIGELDIGRIAGDGSVGVLVAGVAN